MPRTGTKLLTVHEIIVMADGRMGPNAMAHDALRIALDFHCTVTVLYNDNTYTIEPKEVTDIVIARNRTEDPCLKA